MNVNKIAANITRDLLAARNITREVPEEFVQDRNVKGKTVMVTVKGDKLIVKVDGNSYTYPNEWKKGWHNGLKRMLQTPMTQDKKIDAWIKKTFGVEKSSKKAKTYPTIISDKRLNTQLWREIEDFVRVARMEDEELSRAQVQKEVRRLAKKYPATHLALSHYIWTEWRQGF